MLAAEAVVAGAAAVDVASLGAVEGAVEVAHDVEVSPVERRHGVLLLVTFRAGW